MLSRIARSPISIPKGVEITVKGTEITVKGAKGSLVRHLPKVVIVQKEADHLQIAVTESTAESNMQAGTSRAIINNMVHGVTQGFERKLLLVGVGYRASVQGKVLNLALGFSHPVNFAIPDGITIESPSQTEILVKGADKHLVGQTAANIRAYREPEPYKGKGIRYSDEEIILKETKKK